MSLVKSWKKEALLVVVPLLMATGGCRQEGSPAAEAEAAGGQAAPVAPIAAHGGGAAGQAAAAPAAGQAGAIDFELPAGWESQTPSSGMRSAQATIPGPGGPGDLAVFYFGPGQGGAVEANLERWVGQVEGGSPKRESFESNGLNVTWIDVSGTLLPSGMGTGPSSPQPNSRLLAAVVEGPGGPWFFKATGPESTLGPQRDAFVQMLRSVRPRPAAS